MKNTLFFLFAVLLLSSCGEEKTLQSVLANHEQKASQHTAWSYDIHYRMKYFSAEDDTLEYYPNVRLIRHKDDSLYGGSLWIKNDSVEWYYDLEHLYYIDHKMSKVTQYFPHEGQNIIQGNTIKGVLRSYFLKPASLAGLLEDSTATITFSDTLLKNTFRSVMDVQFANEGMLEDQRKTFYFDEKDALKDITFSVKFQNEWQYNEWHFNTVAYDGVTDVDLKKELEAHLENYPLEEYEERDPAEMQPLAVGEQAPDFVGEYLNTGDSVRTADLEGNVMVLDFWYKDCFPCISAIPFLSELHEKYGANNVVVLGLNPFDSKEKNRKKLPEFIETNKMSYPAVFVDKTVTTDFNVWGYPTFYVIDQDGTIQFSEMGYNENNNAIVDSLVNALVNR